MGMRSIVELIGYRDLLFLWSMREIRVRYQQSLLGAGWAILQPLSLTLVFTFVFSIIVPVDTGDIPYPIFSFSAMVPWVFFATSLSSGIPSLVSNMNLVTKIYFPREILPIGTIGAAFVDFCIAFIIFLVMMVIYSRAISLMILWIIPLLLLEIALIVGVTLAGASVIVFFRDMRFVVPLMIQIWFYATPIIYPIELVPEKLLPIYSLNPMVSIITGFRRVLLEGAPPDYFALAITTAVTAVILIGGYALFKRTEPLFADII